MADKFKGVEIDPVKKKLVELLLTTPYLKYDQLSPRAIADHLIANGVTVGETRDCHWATEEAYKNGYKQGKADAMKWISVKERLPDSKGNYLGWTGSTFMVGYYKGNGIWWIWAYDNEGENLFTHWMPLPEPPKGE